MAIQILRPKVTQARLGLGKTIFNDNYVDHGRDGEACIPGTDIPRLRPVPLGPRCIGFPSDEVDQLLERLRALRDAQRSEALREAQRSKALGDAKHLKALRDARRSTAIDSPAAPSSRPAPPRRSDRPARTARR
jgi:predicted DNA-binding transcriptional regulator AlpA